MRIVLGSLAALLLGSGQCLAQVSTVGTTELGVPTTPGAIVSSPLSGPSPFVSLFSPFTVPGAPATTLAAPPLAQNPTLPGTSLSCSPDVVAVSPSQLSVASATTAVSATPATSMAQVVTTTAPLLGNAPTMAGTTLLTSPSPVGVTSMPMSSATMSTPTTMTSLTTQTLQLPPAQPVSIVSAPSGSTTGTISAAPPLGSLSGAGSCTSSPGNALMSSAALPLAIGDIPANPPPGDIQSPVADLGSTSIQPAMTVMPTPNSAACNESVSMNLANPAMMPPANATGAAATPGVMPQGC